MNARRRKSDKHVARSHFRIVNDLRPVNDTDGKSRKIILILGIEAGHFRSFSADQRASRLTAALGDAGHDIGDLLGHILPERDIIEEEHGRGAGADDVVHAHCDAVDAYGIVAVGKERKLQLRSHAVRAGDKNRLLHSGDRRDKQPSEASYARKRALGHRGRDVAFHKLDRTVSGGYIDSRRFIAFAVAFHLAPRFNELSPHGGGHMFFVNLHFG